jgi:sucrose phosphorylase
VFLNFLASHDGIGLTPARGLVEPAAFDATVEEACRRGGRISYKETPDGCFPYELNCVYLDAVAPPSLGGAAPRARAFHERPSSHVRPGRRSRVLFPQLGGFRKLERRP